MWLGVSVTFDLMAISLLVVHGGCGEDGPRGAGRPETCEVMKYKHEFQTDLSCSVFHFYFHVFCKIDSCVK